MLRTWKGILQKKLLVLQPNCWTSSWSIIYSIINDCRHLGISSRTTSRSDCRPETRPFSYSTSAWLDRTGRRMEEYGEHWQSISSVSRIKRIGLNDLCVRTKKIFGSWSSGASRIQLEAQARARKPLDNFPKWVYQFFYQLEISSIQSTPSQRAVEGHSALRECESTALWRAEQKRRSRVVVLHDTRGAFNRCVIVAVVGLLMIV